MIKQILLIGLLMLSIGRYSQAQNAYFPTKGIISFEKEVYTRARMREAMNKFAGSSTNRGMMMDFRGNIDDMPEKKVNHFTLQFDENETLMLPKVEDQEKAGPSGKTAIGRGRQGAPAHRPPMGGPRFGGDPENNKVFYQNLKTQETEIALELDDKYLLKDSLQKITWRFTDEYRNIAGYECRRVNGATADSLYLVAFYTDLIPVSGGPVLVNGLPGMVLGLVIPEMHINYWATKVDFTLDALPKNWQDKKAKRMTVEDFFKALEGNRRFGGGAAKGSKELRRNLLENLIY